MVRKKEKGFGWYIYLISDGNSNYKVGIARNPYRRLKELNTANPMELQLLIASYVHSMENALRVENIIHKELGNHRMENGEWFHLSNFDLRALVQCYLDNIVTNLNDKTLRDDITIKYIPHSLIAKKEDEELYPEAKNLVLAEKRASASLLQRKLSIGYARAARLIDQLEKDGFISEFNGSKARSVIVT
jgi:DNA segregation ATPase FtsK/SpoIIIE-like protein